MTARNAPKHRNTSDRHNSKIRGHCMQARQVRPQSNGRAQKKSARGKGTKRAARMPEASANSGVIKGFFARRTVVGQLRGILCVLIQKEYDEKAPRKKRNGM